MGYSPAHEILARDEEVLTTLEDQLRSEISERKPSIWTESVRDETGPAVPDIDELRDDDRVIDETLTVFEEYSRETLRQLLRHDLCRCANGLTGRDSPYPPSLR